MSGANALVARVLKLSGHDDLLFVVPADHDPFGGVPTARVPHQATGHQRPAFAAGARTLAR
ncbi:MAG: hypothetical protein LH477_16250 [Nocardioides sp.]|nr:hypothetical protein [Nocardioides sp.]